MGEERQAGLILRWDEKTNPLPVCLLRIPQRRVGPLQDAPPWLPTGPADQPFDFCGHVRPLLADISAHLKPLRHIDPSRLLVAMTRSRNGRLHGLQARVTPLRFAQGELRGKRRRVNFQVQRYFLGDQEFFYLLTFCLPRFLDQDFADKITTLIHELYHISPACDGDLRRHEGRYSLHTCRRKHYDCHMRELAREYLSARPDPSLHAFLRLDFAQLQKRHGAVAAFTVPRPKLIPID